MLFQIQNIVTYFLCALWYLYFGGIIKEIFYCQKTLEPIGKSLFGSSLMNDEPTNQKQQKKCASLYRFLYIPTTPSIHAAGLTNSVWETRSQIHEDYNYNGLAFILWRKGWQGLHKL
jgi:hypothetical protein